MTLDVTIGKLVPISFEDALERKLGDYYTYTHNETFVLTDFLDIEQCPDEIDGCSESDTIYPNSAYRSGPYSFWKFFREVLGDLNDTIHPIKTNDRQYTLIKPYLDRINSIEYTGLKQNEIRLHWFKLWCNRAVELYDDKAVICFS